MSKECCSDVGHLKMKEGTNIILQNKPLPDKIRDDSESVNEEDHNEDAAEESSGWKTHWDLLLSLLILVVLLVWEYGFQYRGFPTLLAKISISKELNNIYLFGLNFIAYILAGHSVLGLAFRKLQRGDIFNEFFLMSVATVGAFVIGSYTEGVAVMVFYCIGEWFQDTAVNNAKKSIKALLDIRPDSVTVVRNGATMVVAPSDINLEEVIQVKPGEKLALDGELISENAAFNTAALTGES